jgi:Spy/CpxP family protein refolding chaperone
MTAFLSQEHIMMKYKLPRLVVLGAALAVGLFASTVDAQERPEGDARRGGRGERFDPAQMLERRVSFLTERLQLSSPQQTQVRSILTEELTAMQAFRTQRGDGAQRDENRAQRDSLRTQMRTLRERTEQRIEGVLSEQQRTKYQALRKDMKERRGRGGDDRPRSERRPGARELGLA